MVPVHAQTRDEPPETRRSKCSCRHSVFLRSLFSCDFSVLLSTANVCPGPINHKRCQQDGGDYLLIPWICLGGEMLHMTSTPNSYLLNQRQQRSTVFGE